MELLEVDDDEIYKKQTQTQIFSEGKEKQAQLPGKSLKNISSIIPKNQIRKSTGPLKRDFEEANNDEQKFDIDLPKEVEVDNDACDSRVSKSINTSRKDEETGNPQRPIQNERVSVTRKITNDVEASASHKITTLDINSNARTNLEISSSDPIHPSKKRKNIVDLIAETRQDVVSTTPQEIFEVDTKKQSPKKRLKGAISPLNVVSAEELLHLEAEWEEKLKTSTFSKSPSSFEDVDINVDDDSKVIERLEKVFLKSHFLEAEIVGQFNLGFIIARVHDDLFIFDQHASDEKFRFETLQKVSSVITE